MTALFTLIDDRPDGCRVQAQDHARGPWDPGALHGGPVAALVVRAVERVPSVAPMQLSRITLELERPVPLDVLEVTTSVSRDGARIQVVEATVRAADQVVARARVLRQRLAELPVDLDPALVASGPTPPQPPDAAPASAAGAWRVPGLVAFHSDAVEHRFVAGGFDRLGPAVDWIRLVVGVVEGEDPSPTQRVMAAADFANGVSRVLDFAEHLFINPDLSVHLLRPPVGEWVCLDARTDIGDAGAGMSSSWLFDAAGLLGAGHQSLFVDRR